MNDRQFMEIAFEEARLGAAEGEIPVGAVLVEDGLVLARAHNRRRASGNPLDHAEMIVLREAAARRGDWRLQGTTLYVTLEPCPMCAGALVQARVGRLVFGARDARLGAAGSKYNLVSDETTHHRLEIRDCLMEEECGGLLREWFAARRSGRREIDG